MILYDRMERFLLLGEVRKKLHRMTLRCRLATSPMAGRRFEVLKVVRGNI